MYIKVYKKIDNTCWANCWQLWNVSSEQQLTAWPTNLPQATAPASPPPCHRHTHTHTLQIPEAWLQTSEGPASSVPATPLTSTVLDVQSPTSDSPESANWNAYICSLEFAFRCLEWASRCLGRASRRLGLASRCLGSASRCLDFKRNDFFLIPVRISKGYRNHYYKI